MNPLVPKIIGATLNTLSHFSKDLAGKNALRLFRTPFNGQLLEQDKAFLSTANQEVFYHENAPIQTYHWEGDGPTVCFLHGWESNTARWKTFIKTLHAENCRVIAIDAPAHGGSGGIFSVSLYASFLEVVTQKWRPEILIGHSLGGSTAAYYQKHYQSSIKKLALLGTPSELLELTNRFNRLLNLNQKVRESIQERFQRIFGYPMAEFSVKKYARNFKIPGLVIHDEDDDVAPFSDGISIAKNWKSAKFIGTKGLGHSLQDSDLVDQIRNFVFGDKGLPKEI